MTKEKYEIADKLVRDIEKTERILKTIGAQHWIGFVCAEHSADIFSFSSDTFDADFEKFIRTERAKLMDELEKL